MAGYDYYGNALKNFNQYGTDIIDSYTGLPRHIGGGGGPTGTGPYDPGSPLGSAYQAGPFNLGQSGNLTQLSDLINNINRNAQTQNLQARIPNAPALEQQSSANIGSELKGQVPDDVKALIAQQAAERGVGTGIGPDSANANTAYLRLLGQNSEQQMQAGQANLSQAYARNPAAPIYDPSTQLLTPLDLAKLQEQGLGINARLFESLLYANQGGGGRYANPRYTYGQPTGGGTGTNPLTGGDVFPPDTGNTGGGGSVFFNSPDYSSPAGDFSNNYYDFNPSTPFPGDYGSPAYGTPDYASTPDSVYG